MDEEIDSSAKISTSVAINDCSSTSSLFNKIQDVDKINKGKQLIPSEHSIMKNSAFGKPSLDHSFTSEASFEHILVFILKKDYMCILISIF